MLGMLATARHALRGGAVDAERIFAALDAYLLAGLVFGMCYWLLGRVDPLAFNETDLSLARATYFSFVTLATLGYGDVVPRRELVQSLAIVEAVGGQMYLAVLIARLVSLYSRQAEMGRPSVGGFQPEPPRLFPEAFSRLGGRRPCLRSHDGRIQAWRRDGPRSSGKYPLIDCIRPKGEKRAWNGA
jgi:hypothetical protein